jgi:hypothetical protein
MIVYVGAGSGPLRDLIIAAGHGQMVSRQPSSFRIPKHGRWAFDNGAFIDWKHGLPFDNEQYLKRLRRIAELPDDKLPDWCVCPDIVGTTSSLAYSLEWKDLLSSYAPRLKWYLALQDYVHPDDVDHALCLEKFDGLFIGGTTPWKLQTSPAWVEFGHKRGLPVHIARVNGPARLQWSVNIAADSVDGTGWVHAGEKWLPYLQDVPEKEILLFEESKEFPEQWLAFGSWLKEIWSEKDWKTRFDEEQDLYDWVDSVWSLKPKEFVEWFNRAYGVDWLRLPEEGFSSQEEYREWANDNLAYVERFTGTRPAPPLAETPAFVVNDQNEIVPLSQALGPHKSVAVCATTGRESLVTTGPKGVVIESRPLFRGHSIQDALAHALEQSPGQEIVIPEHAKTARKPATRRK